MRTPLRRSSRLAPLITSRFPRYDDLELHEKNYRRPVNVDLLSSIAIRVQSLRCVALDPLPTISSKGSFDSRVCRSRCRCRGSRQTLQS